MLILKSSGSGMPRQAVIWLKIITYVSGDLKHEFPSSISGFIFNIVYLLSLGMHRIILEHEKNSGLFDRLIGSLLDRLICVYDKHKLSHILKFTKFCL